MSNSPFQAAPLVPVAQSLSSQQKTRAAALYIARRVTDNDAYMLEFATFILEGGEAAVEFSKSLSSVTEQESLPPITACTTLFAGEGECIE